MPEVKRVYVQEEYQMRMSEEEARFVRDVMRSISGDALRSRRWIADQIDMALDKAGAPHTADERYDMSGTITCSPEEG